MNKQCVNNTLNIDNRQVKFISLLLIMSEIINESIFLIIIIGYLSMLILNIGILKKSIKINSYLNMILIIGFVGGVIQLAINSYDIRDIIRDISRFLTPVVFIAYGIYLRYKKNINIEKIYIAIISASIIIEIRHLLLILFNIKGILNGISIRGIGGNGSYITSIAIIILLFNKNNTILEYINRRFNRFILIAFLLILFVCYLSRTHLIVLLIGIIINIFAAKRIKFKQLKSFIVYFLIIISIAITIVPKDTLNQFINKSLNSIEEISSESDHWNQIDINKNWRGYEVYRTKELFKEANVQEVLFGFGFGKRVNLNLEIYLGDGNTKYDSIPTLHNGYYYILLKTGIFGVAIYTIFFIKIALRKYKKIYNDDFESKLLCIVGLATLFTNLVVCGIYNRGSIFVFCLIIGFSFYDENQNNYLSTYDRISYKSKRVGY